jgi:hypothetical protein
MGNCDRSGSGACSNRVGKEHGCGKSYDHRFLFTGRRQMPLPGKVVAAPPGLHGFDANSVLNRRICEVAKARGFEFCIRYVSRQDVQPVGDLSDAEANVILDAGLAVLQRMVRRS